MRQAARSCGLELSPLHVPSLTVSSRTTCAGPAASLQITEEHSFLLLAEKKVLIFFGLDTYFQWGMIWRLQTILLTLHFHISSYFFPFGWGFSRGRELLTVSFRCFEIVFLRLDVI